MPDGFKSTVKAPLPSPPLRQFSFTDVSTTTPTAQQPGDRMDAEYDRSNQATTDLINFCAATFNTDGSLIPGSVGLAQLDPTIVEDISNEVTADLEPLVDQAGNYAAAAAASASDAAASETTVTGSASAAAASAAQAGASATSAAASAGTASTAATTAQNAALAAQDAANNASGDEALSSDLALVCQAWAEHMPDPIPPNILAVMGVTGDHWSSRWWANKAAGALGELASLYLGALPSPPTSTATGDPIPLGAIYYNTSNNTAYVWNGTEWQPLYTPAKAYTLSLIYRAAAGQTAFNLTTPDINGNVWTIDAADPELLEVFANGVRLIQAGGIDPGDWQVDNATSTVTLAQPALAGTTLLIDILAPAGRLSPSTVTTQLLLDFDVDPITGNPGLIDGSRTTFNLALASDRSLVTVATAVEIQVFVDGITQKPGKDYNVSGDTITFGEPPTPGGTAWAIWFENPASSSTARIIPAAWPPPTPVVTEQPDPCVCPVGTLLTSLLPPSAFAVELGGAKDWVPADGRGIQGTRLAQLLRHDTAPRLNPRTAHGPYYYVRVN